MMIMIVSDNHRVMVTFTKRGLQTMPVLGSRARSALMGVRAADFAFSFGVALGTDSPENVC